VLGFSAVRPNLYLQQLRAVAAAARRDHAARQRPHGRLRSSTPLTKQITELMNSLPPVQRSRPWSIVDLQGRLQGRYKERPSLGDIGLALRALGWVRVRDWTNSGGGRRFWREGAQHPR
jgi:hypothetical protein